VIILEMWKPGSKSEALTQTAYFDTRNCTMQILGSRTEFHIYRRGEREVGQISIYVDIIYLTREIFLRLVVGGDDVHTAFQAGPSTSFFVTGDGTPLFRSPASTLIVPLCNRNMAREILYACHEAGLGRKRNLNPVLLHQCMTLLAICQAGDSTVLVTIGVSPTIRFAVCMCCLAKVHLDI
jgi:hypothetical protein